jgi:hypothetical protein
MGTSMDNAEIKSLILEEREKIRRELRDDIDSLFKKESESVQEKIGLYLSTAKWVTLGIAAVLTAFGISKASDVETAIVSFLKDRVEKKYGFDSPDSTLSVAMNKMVSTSVAASVYLEATAQNEGGWLQSSENSVRKTEINILLEIVQDPASEYAIFQQALTGLSYLADREAIRSSITQTLAKMLSDKPENDYDWIIQNESKIISILKFSDSINISSAAITLISKSDQLTDDIIDMAINRFRNENYTPAANTIAKIAKTTKSDETLVFAIMGLIELDPASPDIDSIVLEKLVPRNSPAYVRNITVASSILSSRGSRNTPEFKRDRFLRLAVPLIKAAIDKNVTVTYDKADDRLVFHDSLIGEGWINSKLFEKEWLTPILKSACDESPQMLYRYLQSIAPRNTSYRILATLDTNSIIKSESGSVITPDSIRDSTVEIVAPPSRYSEVMGPGAFRNDPEIGILEFVWYSLEGSVQKAHGTINAPQSFEILLD